MRPDPPSLPGPGQASPLRLSLALFLVSFATVLFTLSVWKLLAFFIMPSLFFDLLFVGFPVGAFLGVKFCRLSLRSFVGTLWILQAVMALSVLACLACKRFDYLRAHLFDVEIWKLAGQMGTFTLLFLPFFCAYGLSEYVGYQVGTQVLRGRMRRVYALYLFGAAGAYLFVELVLHRNPWWAPSHAIGVSHLLCLAIALAAAATVLLTSGGARLAAGIEAAALALLLFTPGLEGRFLALYKGQSPQSTKQYLADRYREVFQKWGRYSLTEILEAPDRRTFSGFYNDIMQWEYARGTGFDQRMLGAVPLNHARRLARQGRIAIIGAGGGRQVKWALGPEFAFERILAIELEPAVFDAVRGTLRAEFDQVYEAPNVVPQRSEARRYMEETSETFDLIFLPSVGGYPQMMLEPGNMIRTLDAYRTLQGRLTEHGILAIWYPSGLDPRGILTREYVQTLQNATRGLGMKTRAYVTTGPEWEEYLILAAKDPAAELPGPEAIDAFLTGKDGAESYPLPAVSGAVTRPVAVPDDPRFKPITDEQPFLAGNVRHIFSMTQVYELFAGVAACLLVAGAAAVFGLRRRGDPQIPGRSYWQVAGLSLLVGANFILVEHYFVLALFKRLYVYHEALVTGAIGFLVLSGLGSVVITRRSRGKFLLLAVLLLGGLLVFQDRLPPAAVFLGVAPVAFVTGSLFPALFEQAARNPLAVFAMDALGAALGSMLAFFIPIAFGFSVFFPATAVVFCLTALSTWFFYRGLGTAAAG